MIQAFMRMMALFIEKFTGTTISVMFEGMEDYFDFLDSLGDVEIFGVGVPVFIVYFILMGD